MQRPNIDNFFLTLLQPRSGRLLFQGLAVLMIFLAIICIPATLTAQTTEDDTLSVDSEDYPEDTASVDSPRTKKIKIKTDWLDPVALMNGYSLRQETNFKLDELMYPDFIDRQGGFSTTLGQWGKPYQRFRYGTEASNFELGNYVHPINGTENVYFLDPQYGMRYYDTRTPYVNAYYAQGRADAAQLRIDVAQNVNPLLNFSLLYYRRQCNGVYSNFVTDHNTLGATSNFHTLNERYQVYGHFLLQKHDDALNGGVLPLLPDLEQFEKGSQPVVLLDARYRRLSRAASFRQFYRIIKDTVATPHSLQVYNGFIADYLINQFIDQEVSPLLNTALYPVYPTIGPDSTYFFEKSEYIRKKVDAGITYRYLGPNFKARQRIELSQEFGVFKKNLEQMDIRRFTILWKGQLKSDPNPRELEANWTYRQTFSNVFNPESYAELDVAYRFPKWQLDYSHRVPGPPLKPEDSATITKTHRPLALQLHLLSYGRNPTLQQAFGEARPGNNMAVLTNFSNRRINHFNLGLELRGKDQWTTIGELRGNSIRISAFTTRQAGMIYFTPKGWDRVSLKESAVFAGAELKLRLHAGKFFLETETVLQGYSSEVRKLDTLFRASQPKFYTKTSLFYENKDLKFAGILRLGVDCWYFSSFSAPYFDPAAQAFYRQEDYTVPAYPRLDGFVATQIKRAYLYIKMINLLENLPQPGYFTTMGYPMPVRQLMFGLNWTFFD
jgi:hypothetical protein